MPFADLREFLNRLEAGGELDRIPVEVDLDYEIGAICRRSADLDGPALLVERVRGHSMPIIANLLTTRRRVAAALDSTPERIVDDWRERVKRSIPPVVVSGGACKMMAMAILGCWAARGIKTLIIVDSDIDPYNPTEVDWALASRVQPDRDVEILKGMVGPALDPSLPRHERVSGAARTSKMIIDATRYDAATYEKPVLPRPDVFERVLRDWDKYGIRSQRSQSPTGEG